jgi:Rrf2 family protein
MQLRCHLTLSAYPRHSRDMAANSRFAVSVHTLAVMAYHRDEWITSETIASSVNTNAVVIRRILQALTQNKLVSTVPGKNGGSRLAKEPSKITLMDIYQAVQPEELFALHSKPKNRQCAVSCNIKELLNSVFGSAEDALKQSLKKTTLEDLIKKV